MPSLILLDVSLSMARGWRDASGDASLSQSRSNVLNLATIGITTLLDFFSQSCKLEYVSLLQYSSLWEALVPFTRDYQVVREKVKTCTIADKTCLEAGLIGAATSVTDDWDSGTPVQVIVFTDGSPGIGSTSLQSLIAKWSNQSGQNASPTPFFAQESAASNRQPLPLPFSSKLHFVLLSSNKEPYLEQSISHFEKLIEINGGQGSVFHPDTPALSPKSIQQMIHKLAEKYFLPFYGTLKCGHMTAKIQLYPPPMGYERQLEFKKMKKDISSVLDIIGFMNISDIASPPSVSRHLLLPIPQKLDINGEISSSGKENSTESDPTADQVEDEAKTPSFNVLLHGSLRRENKVALAIVGDEWYAMIYSWANSKKKSNLMISLLEPGTQSLPWLGDIDKLVPVADFGVGADKNPYGEDEDKTPFPVQIQEKKSYSQNCVVWIKPDRLQTDIQKILRHARKLPDKMQNFYKELNRLRRAALSFGFMELLEGMSNMLERECALLQHNNTHPNSAEAALQLNHAAQSLRNSLHYRDVSQNIMPLKSNFSGVDG